MIDEKGVEFIPKKTFSVTNSKTEKQQKQDYDKKVIKCKKSQDELLKEFFYSWKIKKVRQKYTNNKSTNYTENIKYKINEIKICKVHQ